MTPEKREELKRKAAEAKRYDGDERLNRPDDAMRARAEWFVAASPDAVLALLAENEAQAAEIQRLRDALEGAHHFVKDGMHIAAESVLAQALGLAPFAPANPESKTSAPPRAG